MWAQILCYKNQGIHWYHCNPTFLWQINFRLVWRLISALIWDISGLWNRSDCRNYREKRIAISRFLALYILGEHDYLNFVYFLDILFLSLKVIVISLDSPRLEDDSLDQISFTYVLKCGIGKTKQAFVIQVF